MKLTIFALLTFTLFLQACGSTPDSTETSSKIKSDFQAKLDNIGKFNERINERQSPFSVFQEMAQYFGSNVEKAQAYFGEFHYFVVSTEGVSMHFQVQDSFYENALESFDKVCSGTVSNASYLEQIEASNLLDINKHFPSASVKNSVAENSGYGFATRTNKDGSRVQFKIYLNSRKSRNFFWPVFNTYFQTRSHLLYPDFSNLYDRGRVSVSAMSGGPTNCLSNMRFDYYVQLLIANEDVLRNSTEEKIVVIFTTGETANNILQSIVDDAIVHSDKKQEKIRVAKLAEEKKRALAEKERAAAAELMKYAAIAMRDPKNIGELVCRDGTLTYQAQAIIGNVNMGVRTFTEPGQISAYIEGHSPDFKRVKMRVRHYASKEGKFSYVAGTTPSLDGISASDGAIIWDLADNGWYVCS